MIPQEGGGVKSDRLCEFRIKGDRRIGRRRLPLGRDDGATTERSQPAKRRGRVLDLCKAVVVLTTSSYERLGKPPVEG